MTKPFFTKTLAIAIVCDGWTLKMITKLNTIHLDSQGCEPQWLDPKCEALHLLGLPWLIEPNWIFEAPPTVYSNLSTKTQPCPYSPKLIYFLPTSLYKSFTLTPSNIHIPWPP
jgi:hypothetical protein